jgi:hypothetical protein
MGRKYLMPFIRKALESRFMARVENHKKTEKKAVIYC